MSDTGSEKTGVERDRSRLGRAMVWSRRIGLALIVALLLGYLPFELYGEKGVRQYLRLKRELKEIRTRNGRLRRQVSAMRREIEALRDDRATLERVARDELGLIRDGEKVYVVRKQRWP